MPEPNRRVRPKALITLALVIAGFLACIAAGVRFMTRGHSAPPAPRALASDTGVGYDYARPASPRSAAPAVSRPKLTASRTAKPLHPHHSRAPNKPVHPPRHSPGPKSHAPAQPQPAHQHHSEQPRHQQPHVPTWMLLDHAVLDMQAAGASPKLLSLVNQSYNLVSTPLYTPQPLTNPTRIQVFNSYAKIAQAIADHTIARNTRAVVYDNERFTHTPANELADPVRYCRLTAKLLHQKGLKYIASPGFDLSGRRPADHEWFQQFVQAGLMRCATDADYLDIQDQLQQGTTVYAHDAQEAVRLLRQINPRAKLLMGLSTSPSGRLDSAGQLWRAYQDTRRYVNGYWLNVPRNVSGHSRPTVALHFLQNMVTH
jgi:hypothetical protein